MALARDGDLALLHHFQKRALHLGGRAVDFVGQHQIGEHRPQHGGEFAALLVVDAGADQVGGHQIGRELDALEAALHGARQGRDRQGLGQARHAFDQKMPAGQKRDQHPFQEMILADHDLLHFIEKMLQPFMRATRHVRHPFRYRRIIAHRLGGILDRHGKGHAGKDTLAGGIVDRRHDTHDFAVAIDQRPAGIARIHRRGELDQVGEGGLVLVGGIVEFAFQARHHAGGDRRADAEGKAHRHHRIAGKKPGGRGQGRGLEIVRLGLGADHRQIIFRLHIDHGGFRLAAVEEGHHPAIGGVDHMQVGEDVALVVDHHARAGGVGMVVRPCRPRFACLWSCLSVVIRRMALDRIMLEMVLLRLCRFGLGLLGGMFGRQIAIHPHHRRRDGGGGDRGLGGRRRLCKSIFYGVVDIPLGERGRRGMPKLPAADQAQGHQDRRHRAEGCGRGGRQSAWSRTSPA